MAQSNKRYFNTFFFEDPYIEDLNKNETLLYLTLILNPHNNLAGCYEISIRKLMNYTKLTEDEVKLGIQKLTEDRKILFSGNWIALKNFIKNNELNPNMCKKAFDLMSMAPKDKVLFILSDAEGDIEPWVTEFVSKVESGINSSIDSQNRNALNLAKRKNNPIPAPKPHKILNVENFLSSIFNKKNKKIGGRVGGTIPNQKGDTSVEYKKEIEFEVEKEIEEEKETSNEERRQVVDNVDNLTKNILKGKKVN